MIIKRILLRNVAFLALGFVVLVHCDESSARRIQPYWSRSYERYELVLSKLERGPGEAPVSFMPVRDQRGNCFSANFLACVATQRYGFWLELTNTSNKPVRILWPEVRYVDELAAPHEVFWRQLSLPLNAAKMPPKATAVQPNQTLRASIQPSYKSYWVQYNRLESGEFSEPLVPTKLEGMSEQQMKAYVDDLAKRQVPVKLVLPIEIDGVRYGYTFTFVLKPRWADLPKQ